MMKTAMRNHCRTAKFSFSSLAQSQSGQRNMKISSALVCPKIKNATHHETPRRWPRPDERASSGRRRRSSSPTWLVCWLLCAAGGWHTIQAANSRRMKKMPSDVVLLCFVGNTSDPVIEKIRCMQKSSLRLSLEGHEICRSAIRSIENIVENGVHVDLQKLHLHAQART